MSLSNPTVNAINPCTRWMEWSGGKGVVKYYDKETKEDVIVGDKLAFILLDSLSCITGYNKAAKSGITSNEVRDTRKDELFVRLFRGNEQIAHGLYKDIKDRVTSKSVGGKFATNLYVAYRTSNGLAIGSLKLFGASLSAWMDFSKENRNKFTTHGIKINGFTEHTNGATDYRAPVFELASLKPETIAEAVALDVKLQEFLNGYLSRTKADDTNQETRNEDYSQERDQSHEYGDEEIDDDYSRNQSKPTLTQPVGGITLSDSDVPF